MTNNEKIAVALKSDYLSELSVYEALPDYRIRFGFDRQMRKMISRNTSRPITFKSRRRIRLRLVIAAVIAATAAIATGGTILLKHWDAFSLKENDKYSLLFVSDTENSPQYITQRYEPDFDRTGFTSRLYCDNEYSYWIDFTDKNGRELNYMQCVRSQMDNARLGTENAQVPPEKVEIGELSALYYVGSDGTTVLIWDNGEYIFNIMANGFAKDEVTELALSLKEVEK